MIRSEKGQHNSNATLLHRSQIDQSEHIGDTYASALSQACSDTSALKSSMIEELKPAQIFREYFSCYLLEIPLMMLLC